jgi:uncharacterized membrane protein
MADNTTDNLVVLTFEGSETAGVVYSEIESMEEQKLLVIQDAIIIERGEQTNLSRSPDDAFTVKQTHARKGKVAAKGAGIGLLAGWLLGGPIGGAIVGAGIGAITGALKDFGIDNKNIDAIKARLQPNSSALLVLGHVEDRDAFLAKVRTYDPQVAMSSLSPEVEKELRARLSSS